jgi:hypothetical protein
MEYTTQNTEDQVRQRAYELWEQHGCPSGGEQEFWLQAEREINQGEELKLREAQFPSAVKYE